MREFFSQFGKVVDATVMLDRETGRSKGFGFVSFENVNVEPLLGFGNLEIDGKMVCSPAHFQQSAIIDFRNHRSMSS
jgi:RNA-binding protein Musashi